MRVLLCATAAVALMAATPAAAEMYGTIGLTHVDVGATGVTDSGKMGFEAITGRVGANLAPVFGVEAEGSFGWEEGTTRIPDPLGGEDLEVSLDLSHDIAVFAVGRIPITDNANVFARLGYGWTTAEIDVDGVSDEDTVEGHRWGVGAEFLWDAANGLRIDFTRIDNDELAADAYTISYVRKFG